MISFRFASFFGKGFGWYGFFFLAGMSGVLGGAYLAGRSVISESAPAAEEMPQEVTVRFEIGYREAIQQGMNEGKPVLLFFSESGSLFSERVRREAFSDEKIVALSRSFICAEIDTGKLASMPVMKKYGVTGSPTVQFISARGVPLLRVERFDTVSEFKAQMEAILHPVAWQQASRFLR